jgi:hypothetical protein
MPKSDKGAPKMRGYNQRNKSGQLRKIRDDTRMKTLNARYHMRFPGRGLMEWGTFQINHGVQSVKSALRKFRR